MRGRERRGRKKDGMGVREYFEKDGSKRVKIKEGDDEEECKEELFRLDRNGLDRSGLEYFGKHCMVLESMSVKEMDRVWAGLAQME